MNVASRVVLAARTLARQQCRATLPQASRRTTISRATAVERIRYPSLGLRVGLPARCTWRADRVAILRFSAYATHIIVCEFVSWCAAHAVILDVGRDSTHSTAAPVSLLACPVVLVTEQTPLADWSQVADGVF